MCSKSIVKKTARAASLDDRLETVVTGVWDMVDIELLGEVSTFYARR